MAGQVLALHALIFLSCVLVSSKAGASFLSPVSVKEDVSAHFGTPRDIPQAPSIGLHPRALFDESEFEDLIERYAAGQEGSWEAYFRTFTAGGHGPTNEALTLLYEKDIGSLSDDILAELAEGAGWGTKSNGAAAKMEEPTSTALYMMAFQAFLQTKMDPEGTDSPLFEKLTVLMDKWARIIVAHADKYQCIESAVATEKPCVNRGGIGNSDYRKYLWQRDWNLNHEWRTGS